MKNLYFGILSLLTFASIVQANVLIDGSFESGDLSNWNFSGIAEIKNPEIGAHDGSLSLRLIADGGVSQVNQGMSGKVGFVAAPGQEFNLSGYFLTEMDLSSPGFTVGMFKIVFEDSVGNHLEPESLSIGSLNALDAPGAESTPVLNSSSERNTWIFSETQAVAPPGTSAVQFLALNISLRNENITEMYFDNMTVVRIPEASTFALCAGFAAIAFVIYYRQS